MHITHLIQVAKAWTERAHGTPLDIASAHRDYAIALLLIHTGITISEVCKLNTHDFALSQQGERHLNVGMPQRQIPLNRDMHQAISRWLVLRQLTHGTGRVIALFVTRNYERIHASSVKQIMHRLRQESSIAFTNFDLRHAFIRRMVQSGYLACEISQMLSRPSHTLIEAYAAVTPTAPRATAGRMLLAKGR